jgi:hypothetical protein
MAKKKTIIDKEKSDQKKVFRTPTAKPTVWHDNKKAYKRKPKYPKGYDYE